MSKFDINDFNNNTPLSGEFLLGYHCQKMAFYLAKQTKKTDEKTDTNQKINA
jgi:CRISPR-associated protein Csd1